MSISSQNLTKELVRNGILGPLLLPYHDNVYLSSNTERNDRTLHHKFKTIKEKEKNILKKILIKQTWTTNP